MNDDTRIWRLPLPADWEPEDYWCVSFQIPAGEDYVQALSAAIGLLTISKTFERDETHTGAATVARTWERAIYLAPMTVNETCVPVAPIPIPDAAAAADASAAIFKQFYRVILHELNTCAPTTEDCAGCVDTLYATLTPYGASEAVRGALMRLCADLNTLTTEQREDYETDCPWQEQFDDLSDNIADNPFDWLNKLSDWLFDWLNNTANEIMDDLNTIGGLMTGNGIAGWLENNGGIDPGGGAGFGGDCAWEHVIDFELTDDGWLNYQSFVDNGAYSFGTGWVSEFSTEYASDDIVVIDIARTFLVPFQITHLFMTFDIAAGGWTTLNGPPAYAYLSASPGTPIDVYNVSDGSHIDMGGTVSGSCSSMRCQLIAGDYKRPNFAGSPGGSATLKSITVRGVGFNPWA
jgi:hypothetical protein